MAKQKTKKRLKNPAHGRVHAALVPHKSNQYRPHLIRRYGLMAVVIAALTLNFGGNFVLRGSVLGDSAPIAGSQLLTDTNTVRAEAHVAPLRENSQLDKAAALKLDDMFTRQYWAHNAPDGTTPWHWVDESGYSYVSAGENLAKGFSAPGSVVTAWYASPEHRANLLGTEYQDVGFASRTGELDGQRTSIVVALYGGRTPVAAAGTGVVAGTHVDAPQAASLAPMTRFGMALQSLTPAAIGSLAMILLVSITALIAHAYRNKLPKPLKQSWYRHHGLYKAFGLVAVAVVLVGLYGGGQI